MITKNLIALVILITIAFGACKKEDIAPKLTNTGELIDSGSPALDGAGYFIRLDNNEELKPDRLPDTLEVPGIRVRIEVTYERTDKRYPSSSCGTCPGMPIIHIINIKKI